MLTIAKPKQTIYEFEYCAIFITEMFYIMNKNLSPNLHFSKYIFLTFSKLA